MVLERSQSFFGFVARYFLCFPFHIVDDLIASILRSWSHLSRFNLRKKLVNGLFFDRRHIKWLLRYTSNCIASSFFSSFCPAKFLKRIFKQPRPEPASRSASKTTAQQDGMPSSHAQSLFFFATHLSLALHALSMPWRLRAVLALALWAYCVWGAADRVWSGRHTVPQVAVGSALGAAMGALAFAALRTRVYGL